MVIIVVMAMDMTHKCYALPQYPFVLKELREDELVVFFGERAQYADVVQTLLHHQIQPFVGVYRSFYGKFPNFN